MKPNDKIKASMSGIDWDDDGEGGLPLAVEREYEAADFAEALSYDPATDEYSFDEDLARDRIADLLSDEFGFCVNHVDEVKFGYRTPIADADSGYCAMKGNTGPNPPEGDGNA